MNQIEQVQIYESENYLVYALLDSSAFELTDRAAGRIVWMDENIGSKGFLSRIRAWQMNMPTSDEVDEVLSGYACLAQIPILVQ